MICRNHFSNRMSHCLSVCHRNLVKLCGWHLVRSQVSMCDAGGDPQPPVLFHQHDCSLLGAWHHIYVSYYFLLLKLWTNKTKLTLLPKLNPSSSTFVLSNLFTLKYFLASLGWFWVALCFLVIIIKIHRRKLLCPNQTLNEKKNLNLD